MTRLRVKMRRDLWRMRWRALAIIMTIASGVAVYVGVYTGIRSLFSTRDRVYERLQFADLEVRFVPEDVHNLPDLSDLAGVETLERRLVFPGIITSGGKRPLSAVMTFLETPSPEIHAFDFVAGRPFRADEWNAVVIERSLAVQHGYRVGDAIAVKIGEKTYDSRIVGIAISPEYFVATANPDYFIPAKGSLGVVFANLARVRDSLGFTLVDDLLFRFQPGTHGETRTREVVRRLNKLNIEQVIPRTRHFSYRFMQTDLEAIQFFIPAMVVILLGLAGVITFLNFNRMVALERREIGALLALGYDRRALARSYVEGSLVLGLLGGMLGVAGSFPLRTLFAELCADSMGMPFVWMVVDPALMAKGVGYGVLVASLAALTAVLTLLRLPLPQVMREPRRALRRQPWVGQLLTRAPFRLPASYRYGLRNLVRRRERTVATLASLALALGVATAYRLSAGSVDATLLTRYEREPWELVVDFLYPVFLDEVEDLKAIPQVQQVAPYLRRYVELEHNGRVEDATLLGLDPDSRMTRLALSAGQGLRSPDAREIVLSLELARKLGVDLGDTVHVHALNQAYSFRLVGLLSDVIAGISIVPFRVAQEICQFPEKASGLYLHTQSPGAELSDALYRREFVGKVLEKTTLAAQLRRVLSPMIVVLDIAAGISLFVALLFTLTSVNLSVLENEGEFATLQAIGYGRGSIARIVFTETWVYAIGAVLLSVPVAVLLTLYLNHRIGQAWFRVDTFFFLSEFAKLLGPALILIPLGASLGLRRIFRLDISAALRTRAIE